MPFCTVWLTYGPFQMERSVSSCLQKASVLWFNLQDATSSSRAALDRCSRRRCQEECITPEDFPAGSGTAEEFHCDLGYIDRCPKVTSRNHRTTDLLRSGGPAIWPSPSTADIRSSHILREGRSRRVARTADARRRKVPSHGLA